MEHPDDPTPAAGRRLRLGDLPAGRPVDFDLRPEADERARIAAELGLVALKKLRLAGRVRPEGRRDWHLEAELGATVVQPCVVTLAPVTTRIDETVERRYLAEMPPPPPGETEMPEDETAEPLPATLDLGTVMREALALALPLYPRAEGVGLAEAAFTEPGKTPLTDEAVRPFAGLEALRDRLARDDED